MEKKSGKGKDRKVERRKETKDGMENEREKGERQRAAIGRGARNGVT